MNGAIDLTGKVALVTGSSRGIGAGIIRALGECGAVCIVSYVADTAGKNEAGAKQVAAEIDSPHLVQCDVGNASEVAAMLRFVQERLGGLDILVNNAGILRDRTIKKMTADDWDDVLRINLTGTFHCIQQAATILRPGGRIVNLSSVSGQLGFFGQANYSASKAGVIALTKTAARELARQQITVNAVAPGFIDTDMTRTMPADVTQKFIEQIPLARIGTVDDVVNAVRFLCSPASQYITGQVLHVNGGFYM